MAMGEYTARQDTPMLISIRHSHNRRTPIVGFSATFTRPDQLALSAAFEKIVYHAEIATMLKAGW